MTIHFTADGVYADTEEEKLNFYDRLHRGDPVILGHIAVWQFGQKMLDTGEEDIKCQMIQ